MNSRKIKTICIFLISVCILSFFILRIKNNYTSLFLIIVAFFIFLFCKRAKKKRFRKNHSLKTMVEFLGILLIYHCVLFSVLFCYMVFLKYDPDYSSSFDTANPFKEAILQGLIVRCDPGTTECIDGICTSWNNDCFLAKSDFLIDKNVSRILFLGDSFTRGAGVDMEKSFVSSFDKKLKEKGYNYEIMNLGVGAANLPIHIERLKRIGLKYSPDIVVVQLLNNDVTDEQWVYSQRKMIRYIFFDTTIIGKSEFFGKKIDNWIYSKYYNYYRISDHKKEINGRLFVGEFEKLYNLSKKYEFEVVILSFPLYIDQQDLIRNVVDTNNWLYINLEDEIGYSLEDPQMVISQNDYHPSEYAHGLVSNELFEKMEEMLNR